MLCVSVIIPTYNRADLLPETIDSILNQTVLDFELIIIDDGSTDNTSEVVARFKDPRLRYVYQKNQGRSVARNHGAKLAQGEFLGFLDSDDKYLPDALESHLKIFNQNGKIGMAVGGYQYVDAQGQLTGERQPWTEGRELDLPGWLFNCFATPGSILVRKAWFERTGGFDSNCEIAEDWDFFLQLAQKGCPMAWTPQAVCQYRQHPGNSIRALAKHRDGSLRAMDKLFCQPNIRPEIAALDKKAKAWVHVVFSKKAYATGQIAPARQDLSAAIQLDLELSHNRKTELLEFLITSPGNEVSSIIFSQLPEDLKVKPGDIRRAQARVEMARFFQALSQGTKTKARQHLRAGLRLDPRWLANRGVLTFGFRDLLHTE
jgi:hypothetical protein